MRSVLVTMSAQAAKFIVGLAVTMVLARLLTPRDYGVVAMVGVFTGFVAVFREGGLSTATVQRPDITEAQLSTLFWINTALGAGTALVLALSSPFVAWLYSDSALVWMVLALALPFVLGGLSVQLQALLQREMKFKAIAIIEIGSLIVASGVGIWAAAAGWGSWALVLMTVVSAVANTVLVFVFCRWRPTRPVWEHEVRAMVRFGGALTMTKVFDAIAGSVDLLLLGKMFPPNVVGLYTRAQTLMLQPMAQVMPPLLNVGLPVMSRLAEKRDTLRRVFLDLIQLTAVGSSFVTVFILVGAEALIGVLLGRRWIEAASILRLLAGPAFFIPISVLCVLNITAQAKGNVLMRWGLQKNIVTIAAIVAGISWGAAGVAAALSMTAILILMPILFSVTAAAGPANVKEIWGAVGPGLVSCAVLSGVLYLIQRALQPRGPFVELLILSVLNVSFHILSICAVPSCRRALARVCA